jgi:flagellar hook-length control protein FliK
MMEKVEQVLKEAVKAKDGKSVSLKLDPPNLGQMRVDVSLRDGTLHARLTPESPAVAAFLQERAHDLQGMLRKLGLSVDEVTVSVRNEEFTSNENHSEGASSGRKDRSSDEPAGKNFPSGNVVSTAPEHRMSNPVDHWVA